MHRSIVLTAIACLCTAGCARNSTTVAGDPFLRPEHDRPDTTIPEATERQQTASLDERHVDQASFEEPANPFAPAAGSWSTPTADQNPLQVPDQKSANGRTGHFSINYGMGHISTP